MLSGIEIELENVEFSDAVREVFILCQSPSRCHRLDSLVRPLEFGKSQRTVDPIGFRGRIQRDGFRVDTRGFFKRTMRRFFIPQGPG